MTNINNREILRDFIEKNKRLLKRINNIYFLKEKFSNYIKENHLEDNKYMKEIELMICKEILRLELLPINNLVMQSIRSRHILKKMASEASALLIIREYQVQQIHQAMERVRERFYKDEGIAMAKK